MTKRNYRKEYDRYHKRPKQIKRRASRNQARAIMAKRGVVSKGDGKDVHHTTGNPMNNKKLSVSPITTHLPIEDIKKNISIRKIVQNVLTINCQN